MIAARNPALYGALCGLGGTFLFSVNDVLIKGLSGDYALHQIILFRTLAGLLFLFGFLLPCRAARRSLPCGGPGCWGCGGCSS